MLKLLKRWLGWDADASLFDFSDLRSKPQRSVPPVAPPAPSATAARPPAPRAAADKPSQPPRRKPPKEREPLDVLDNPRLTLDKPSADGFDPYNTGAFNRSASWEKIGRQRKR